MDTQSSKQKKEGRGFTPIYMSITANMTNHEVKQTVLSLLREVNRPGMDKLIDYLYNKSDFFTAPASTKYHLSEEGGLARHSLNVYYRMFALVNTEHRLYNMWQENQTEEIMESVKIIALLHDICKCDFYVPSTRNVKNDKTGQWEKVPCYNVQDSFPMGHGEKSLYIVSKYIDLKREEALAIRWHMGFTDEAVKGGSLAMSNTFGQYPLAVMAHIADVQASYLDESRN